MGLISMTNRTPIKTLETAADQILDLIVTEDETPLQTIIIEQLAKIITASSKSIWKDIRKSTGMLPSGRSILGSVIDPLGLWRTSPLVSMTDNDLLILESTRKVIELLSSADSSNQDLMNTVSELSNEEVLELSSLLVQKIWNKRLGVVNTSRRLAFELIKVTADTLERGDRSTIMADDDHIEESIMSRTLMNHSDGSSRLENAKKMLDDLQREENSDAEVVI